MASKVDNSSKNVAPSTKPSEKRHRNPLVYYGTIILLVIVVIAFVAVPAMGSNTGGGNNYTFGFWRSKAITYTRDSFFAQQLDAVENYYKNQGYDATSMPQLHQQAFRQAFELTVMHYAMLDLADRNQLMVTDTFLDKEMAKRPEFVDEGQFSLRRFRETPNNIKAIIRRSVLESALVERVKSDLQPLPNANETAFITEMARQERSIEYVAFPLNAYPDSEKLAFAAANPEPFHQLNLSRITFTGTEQEARQLLAQIESGSLTFEDAARSNSRDEAASRGGTLDWHYTWELRNDFNNPDEFDQLAVLSAGSLSPLFESITGSWLLFKVMTDSQPADPNASTYLTTVTNYLNRFESGRMEDWAIAQAKAFSEGYAAYTASAPVLAPPSFEMETETEADATYTLFTQYAALQTLSPVATNLFPLNYDSIFDIGYISLFTKLDVQKAPQLSTAQNNRDFLKAVFSLPAGQVSEPLLVGGNVIVFQVAAIAEADSGTTSMIEMYYPYLLREAQSQELSAAVLADSRLRDQFYPTYSRLLGN
ncbi:MAG: hypothetical protein A2087_10325 [Spirochaetes bacterium GWD1_61_31]|nr:MAG: hypothetical protein A2Y37_12190 [Spirochaetes bacterium GWB1_60_80]OHD30134.1 MAG: hypothetical protein A2004_14050 [Spirochaetes bacterium GWC1_61_12]OHD34612.1 MAG: hypothetical protein A2087_10325 [Spirochaetes bacterium GWD1_61_31]OHD46428.1 MAG: hypothetical protein A2Y35_10230 [Spirochaetes bacterium GWE1_60_18]OHD59484.1 MAG: hypothetical protein A2Y32_10185 [Spirochaetes bacterium GWF1_60_12]HAW86102.1 hypothetical protein [Spirochaetaceae bacterium]